MYPSCNFSRSVNWCVVAIFHDLLIKILVMSICSSILETKSMKLLYVTVLTVFIL